MEDPEGLLSTIDLVAWGLVLIVFGAPLLAIWTEHSGKRLPREAIVSWIVSFILAAIAMYMLPIPYSYELGAILMLGGIFFFYRALVQRLRDLNLNKGLAYFSVIPVANIPALIYLCAAQGVDAEGRFRDAKQEAAVGFLNGQRKIFIAILVLFAVETAIYADATFQGFLAWLQWVNALVEVSIPWLPGLIVFGLALAFGRLRGHADNGIRVAFILGLTAVVAGKIYWAFAPLVFEA